MSKPKGGLGRGLAALIPTGPQTNVVSDVFLGGSGRVDHPPRPGDDAEPEQPAAGADSAESPSTSTATDSTMAGTEKDRSSTTSDELSVGPAAQQAPVPAEPTTDPDGPRYEEVPIDRIRPNPRNPRTVFDEDALAELEYSIREFGLLQPIVVRQVADGYELVMGERRWRAAQRAGLSTIPAIIRRTEDADLLRDALLENIHRANLNPLEEAAAYQQLLEEFDVTQEELAKRIGRSRPVISNTIRLLRLPVPVQRRVAAGVLSAGHARALLSLELPEEQEELATRVVAAGLSVRGTEEAVVLMAGRTTKPKRATPKKLVMPSLTALASSLSDTFDTRVRVELGRQKGRVIVEFATVADLERIIGIMAPAALEKRRNGGHPRDSEDG
ncbi:ParB family chromosome partitioning protein [Nakamurella sp. UYEF19]|uniref:ParB/RepB/Spo0J family partition protein n=1 Tax=Nakamurella sp. UYEF19 TaxID=1756392 RepID=UPI003399F89D